MTLRIKHRLFLAFFAATVLVVASMFVITKFSFERSLLRYVNTIEQEQLARLEESLKDSYDQHGSWDFLRNNRRAWMRLIASSRHEKSSPTISPKEWDQRQADAPRRMRPPRKGPPPMHQMFEWRISLLDADRRPIFVPRNPTVPTSYRPLVIRDRTVGYLGLIPPRIIIDTHQQRFAHEQRRSMILISLVVAGAAALLSFPLSRRMVQRITTLAAATHRLTTGRYDIRVNATAGDELGQLARDFNSLAQTLESNEQLRRRWVADISHELRTPLAVLRGEIEAVQDGVRQLSSQTLDTLHGEVMRLERLVGDLYELSLSDIGAMQYRKTQIDLLEVLQQSLEAHRAQFAEKGLTLLPAPHRPAKLPMLGDPERLSQLFTNLLKNTLRYTDCGGQLRISIEVRDGWVQLNFQDSAPGVPEIALPRLFDRLYRVESSRSREHGGAGLGLALCKNIVEAHDGTIDARPSPLGGLWIAINLPRNGSNHE